MNMNKILAAGLIAAVASTASMADAGSHGFYVGANIGMDFTKMKVAYDHKEGSTANSTIINKEKHVKKSKPMFRAELALGYDRAYECMVLGIDLTAGTSFGKNKRNYPGWQFSENAGTATTTGAAGIINKHDADADKDYIRVKNQWHASIMPRVGFMVTPKLEIYGTVGLKVAKYKMQYVDVVGTKDGESTSKKSTKYSPIVGAGIRYEFNQHMFAKLEYNFEFSKKLRMPDDMSKSTELGAITAFTNVSSFTAGAGINGSGGNAKYTKMHAHVIKLGIGYRF